ncbi:MAG: hypothetical protein WAQ33_12415 [Gaiellaceae bacterium]
MNAQIVIALFLALASTTLTNVAYLREHDAAAALPALSLRRPLHAVEALLTDRSWLAGFGVESGGFALYVAALALAPLTLVQSISAGGIGILAFASARLGRRRLGRHELAGVLLSMLGLLALAVSLTGGSSEGAGGSTFEILLWLAATAGAAIVALGLGWRFGALAVAEGLAGGLFFSGRRPGDAADERAADCRGQRRARGTCAVRRVRRRSPRRIRSRHARRDPARPARARRSAALMRRPRPVKTSGGVRTK